METPAGRGPRIGPDRRHGGEFADAHGDRRREAPTPGASTTPHASASASPNPSAATSGSNAAVKSPSGGSRAGTCSVTTTGRITDCEKPVAASKLPAGAKNTSTVGSPVSDIASLVDARTWTTGGGNTFPGAEAPFGMVQWSPDTLPNRQRGRRLQLRRHDAQGLQPDARLRPRLRRRRRRADPADHRRPADRATRTTSTTSFSHTGEVAQAGYYSAQSNGSRTRSRRSSPRPRTARWAGSPSRRRPGGLPDIKLQGSQNGTSGDTAQIVGNNEISGSVTSGDFCGESSNDGQTQLYTVYFDITFDQPFTASQVITESGKTDPTAVYLTFDTTAQPGRAGQGRHLLRQRRQRQAGLADREPGLELRRGQGRDADRPGTTCSARSRSPAAPTRRPRSSTACSTRTSSSPTSPAT